ncbi:Rrf2 family transcriptional regulator [Bauldia litoralis]|uniref:DNA-binding transcriptional regulator, IscR family n=1 Tax=Bauldia litoralis TaxID=665467 RepID=A0A1G6AY03_9HYPH|nr:Rrf2 family transcriptional regulator [Bauldia litoralis]SDB13252.1 DNA-binding transcriptional regulator, IscR family [Bauldia litoralis]
MKSDHRLSDVLHVLLHMAHQSGPVTSAGLAKVLRTNPAVVRRTMAGLREHGYVRSGKGHGGGWTLSCDLSEVTMRNIYVALGSPTLFAIGNRSDAPDCLVEKAVNARLDRTVRAAEDLLVDRLGAITLADLAADLPTSGRRPGALDDASLHGGAV